MIIVKEKQPFEEMAIRVILRVEDGFPFTICIMDPETVHKNEPHAHIFEAKKNGRDLGMRVSLFPSIPKSESDIKDAFPIRGKYKPIPEEWKTLILRWARLKNKVLPRDSNWEVLWSQWVYSVN
jgi:hypothetical protein